MRWCLYIVVYMFSVDLCTLSLSTFCVGFGACVHVLYRCTNSDVTPSVGGPHSSFCHGWQVGGCPTPTDASTACFEHFCEKPPSPLKAPYAKNFLRSDRCTKLTPKTDPSPTTSPQNRQLTDPISPPLKQIWPYMKGLMMMRSILGEMEESPKTNIYSCYDAKALFLF